MSETAQAAIQRVTDTLYAPVRYTGSGSPESAVISEPGWLYLDTTANLIYVKKTGSGSTGWVLFTGDQVTSAEGTTTIPTGAGSANQTSYTHNLGAAPTLVRWSLENVNTELGYTPGNEISMEGVTGDAFAPPLLYEATGSAIIYVRRATYSGGLIYVPNKTTGAFSAITTANWRIRFRCALIT